MPMFEWKDEYSVNILEIDAQHKRLVAMTNELFDAMGQGKGQDVLGRILNGLAGYAVTHFQKEEKLMEQYGYPGLDEHKRKHNNLTMKVKQLKQAFETSNTPITLETGNFLKAWLVKHIMVTDKGYSQFLNEKGVR